MLRTTKYVYQRSIRAGPRNEYENVSDRDRKTSCNHQPSQKFDGRYTNELLKGCRGVDCAQGDNSQEQTAAGTYEKKLYPYKEITWVIHTLFLKKCFASSLFSWKATMGMNRWEFSDIIPCQTDAAHAEMYHHWNNWKAEVFELHVKYYRENLKSWHRRLKQPKSLFWSHISIEIPNCS